LQVYLFIKRADSNQRHRATDTESCCIRFRWVNHLLFGEYSYTIWIRLVRPALAVRIVVLRLY